jgi:hypothetical protein
VTNDKQQPDRDPDQGKAQAVRRPIRVHLPGFLVEEPQGLGDVIKHATRSLGIKPCGGCEARAKALNQWVVFSGMRGD